MGLYVMTNMASINAQRTLGSNARLLNRTYKRLSSGIRINSAADDAAGLAISTRFTSQIRGINTAVRNTNDGISMAQTLEGALTESTAILQRMRELSVQAANDINTGADRESIDAEVQQLITELDRIGETTVFNDQQVLNGDFVQRFFHVGANANETVAVTVRDARAGALGRTALITSSVVTTHAFSKGNGDVQINGITIRDTTITDDALSTSFATGSAIAKAQAINDASDFTGVTAKVLETSDEANGDIQGGQLDESNFIRINGEVITGFEIITDDANSELVSQINSISQETGVVAKLDENYRLVLTAVDGRNIEIEAVGNGTAITGLGEGVTTAGLELESEKQFFVDGANFDYAGFNTNQIVGVTAINSVATVNVLDRQSANRTIQVVDRALEQISADRAGLGALQNRLNNTINNLGSISENISAARSRILDADFAFESANLARHQIIQQAGTTILSQANQATQAAVSLLG